MKICAGNQEDRCCSLPCYLERVGILEVPKGTDGSPKLAKIYTRKLVESFLDAVKNDKNWEPIVENSVNKCTESFGAVDFGVDCGIIPGNLYLITNCTFIRNFLNCPDRHPSNIEKCDYTNQFIKECILMEN